MSDYSLPRIKESELPKATSIGKVRVLDNAGKSVWVEKEDLPITEAQVTGLTAALALKADQTELDQLELEQIQGGVYDVSSHNDGAVFESLSTLLGSANLSTLIPESVRHGGMSIRFIQGSVPSSDNKYVQARCMAQSFTTDVAQWQWADEEPTVGSKNLVESGGVVSWGEDNYGKYIENPEWRQVVTDPEDRILYGVKTDGKFYFGDGCPPQVQEYVSARLGSFNKEDYDDIQTFLGSLIDGDTLATLLSKKVDKIEGKSLIDSAFASSQEIIANPEYLQVITDSDDKILEGIKTDGTKIIELPLEIQGERQEVIDNPEYIQVTTDAKGRIIEATRIDGKKVFPGGIEDVVDEAKLAAFKEYVDTQDGALDTRVTALENGETSVDNIQLPKIPDYYFENDYLDNKVRTINEKIRECSNNGDVFFWITDVHWESDRNARYSPSLISYIRQRTNIPRIFNGGDNFDGIEGRVGSPDRAACFDGNIDFTNRLRKALGSDKVYTAIGNHEVITYNTYPEIFYALRQHNDDVVYGDADKSYFYVDNNQQKIRYVVLTSFGVQEEGITPYFRNEFKENPEQLDWLMGTALNLSSDWTVVIFIHGLFMIENRSAGSHYSPKISSLNSRKVAWGEPWEFENVWIDSIENYTNNKIGKVIDHDPRPLDGQGNIDLSLAETVTSVPAIADKFMLYSPNNDNNYNRYVARIQWYSAGQVWKLVWTLYGSYISETSLNIGDEVIIWKAFGGKIAGVIQGHTHADRLHLEAGIPFIISACDKWNEAGGDDLTVTRTKGTITEQHFEVVVLNKTLQKWTFISIGAPASGGFDDNIGEEVQVREVSYQ